ncbi:peptide/nickel transport system permease protein [ANME-1 cluster archaeon GoMg3.2]|nr:peptide/nickel transport system permease protein [ANME-1 cluster archaeon GoMg3.2]
MLHFIIRRLLLMFVVILGATMLTFTIMHFAPGDPAEMIATSRYGVEGLSTETIARIRVEEGLDAPVYVQYLKWLNHVLHGDLGRSLVTGKSVSSEFLARFPATLKLALASMIIALLISIPVGIISATKQYSVVDNASMVGALIGVSMPNFWLGLLLMLLFALYLGLLPVCGYGDGSIAYLILPAITLGTGMAALTTRLTRSSMLEVLKQDYITTARAKGLREKVVIWKHAFRNALIPVVTIVGLQFAGLLEGVVIVETIFAWPGVGKLLVDSIFERDFAMMQCGILFIAVIFVLVNLTVDILYALLDPRIRYEKGGN